MPDAKTTTSVLTNVVTAAYDQVLGMALRSNPCHRAIVDKRPVDVTAPGSSVVFGLYSDMSAATTPLTEDVDPDAVALGNPSQVTVTLYEYGNAINLTQKLEELSFSKVDAAGANLIAWNALETIDQLVRTVAVGGTNKVTANGTSIDATAQATNTLLASDVLNSTAIRYVVSKLRGGSAQPVKDGLYAGYVHPDASFNLRAETGSGGWLTPHEYAAPGSIWAGEVGAYNGAFFIETPRAYQATDGASSAKVSRTLVFGKEALVEAVAVEPHTVMGPVVDKLMRFKPLGWKALIGWAVYRQAALYRIETGSTY